MRGSQKRTCSRAPRLMRRRSGILPRLAEPSRGWYSAFELRLKLKQNTMLGSRLLPRRRGMSLLKVIDHIHLRRSYRLHSPKEACLVRRVGRHRQRRQCSRIRILMHRVFHRVSVLCLLIPSDRLCFVPGGRLCCRFSFRRLKAIGFLIRV